ncbi:hypothetical protein [Haloarcula pellucida]|uniref:Uncharacterized protein n=1 Tax=Haloarcula pellucida TaxID=1427151 RepID=A0A830GM74_9EURY|nr:hypothetical protein [Halomicroarcula pellucida]MBX0348042.1 hypothetical protein [Halomicroarcula pellucida]GGN96630.1 hypothetical protein GCM10009030_25150 [Halomicroarcula pellucida]
MDRRDYLAVGASVGAAAMSGCSSFFAAAETPKPSVPSDRLESGGWEQSGENSGTVLEESYGPVTLQAVQHTLQYQDVALQQTVADRTLGRMETALSVWFASRIDFSPNLDNLPAGVGQAQIVDQVQANARDQFERQMENQGLTSIERTGTGSVDIDTGETAETVNLGAVYPFEGISFDISETERVEIPPTDIGISAILAVWHHGDYVLVSGGAYPEENFEQSIDSDLSEGISVTVDIDLGLEPEAYRKEVRSLVAGVQ